MKFIKILMMSAAFAAALAKDCRPTNKPCYVGGCSNEICSAQQNVASPCIWTAEFACYQDATCERQANGKCGWTQTDSLEQCIEDAQNEEPGVEAPCFVGGCGGEICSAEENASSICLWTPELACYKDATCERQSNGQCGWTETKALKKCLANPPEEPVDAPCYVGGCSNEICSEEEGASSICIWTPELACYKDATCERQANGKCGWTQTEELEQCIEGAQNEEEGVEAPCFVGGCGGEICSEEEGANSICLWTPELACYKDATCERQADGKCGWTETKALKKCIANAGDQ